MNAARLLALLFSFQGRIGRQRYWLGFLAAVGIFLLAYFPYAALWKAFGRSFAVTAYAIIAFVYLFWTMMALTTKRLHDRNKSAWWLLPFYFIPFWLNKWNDRIPEDQPLWWITLIPATLLGLWGLIELGFLSGSAEKNDYGDVDAADTITTQRQF